MATVHVVDAVEGQRRSVLIVEDERSVAMGLAMTLESMRFDVHGIATSGEEAVAHVSTRCPDLILMDVRIEGSLDGVAVASVLRERFDIPIIFLTAYSDDATLQRAKETSPHGYLVKPVRPAELRTTIEITMLRHAMDQRLLESRRQTEVADRLASLGSMAAGIAHEINNPLAVLVANATMARDELAAIGRSLPATSDLHTLLTNLSEMLGDIESASERIRVVVSELRAFCRPTVDASASTSVLRAVEWAVNSTDNEVAARARVAIDVPEDCEVRGDEMRLGQVFTNLIVNAAHAIQPGQRDMNSISIKAERQGDSVKVEVSDTGSGIPPANLDRLFDPFFTTKEPGIGTGLGLSICHGIIHAFGGTIGVTSTVGEGTTVTLVIPVPRTAPASMLTPPVSPNPRRGRLLVIDDESVVGKTMVRGLSEHDVTWTDSAVTALDLLAGHDFDLILLDVMMPTMTGVQFYERLRVVHPDAVRRVVFLTGGALTSEIDEFLSSTANDVLEKPFSIVDLRRYVARHIAENTPTS